MPSSLLSNEPTFSPLNTLKGRNRTTLPSSLGRSSWELREQLPSGRHFAHLPDLVLRQPSAVAY